MSFETLCSSMNSDMSKRRSLFSSLKRNSASAFASSVFPLPIAPAKRKTPILFKTIVYWAVVFLVRFLEKLVEYLFAGGSLRALPEYVATHFTWHRFAAIQIWIFVLFLIYTSVEELNARLGDGELMKIFFTRRSP